MDILENNVVTLMPLEKEHIDGIYEAAQAVEIWQHMSVELTTRQACEHYVADALQKRHNGSDFAFVIIHDQRIIGCTWFLDISAQHKRLEIGSTWLHPDYWRSPINTNCKWLLLNYCFETLHFQRVQIKTGHENIRSQQAIERIGAVKEGILRNHMIQRSGNVRHTVMYSIIKEDWPQTKAHIEGLLS